MRKLPIPPVPTTPVTAGGDVSSASAEAVLSKALDVGEGILRCGGEPHRIEDTVGRICSAYGAAHTDVFALPSLVVAGIRMPDGTGTSQIRRIRTTKNDMFRLEMMNELSRRVCAGTVPLDEVDAELERIRAARPFPEWLEYLGGVIGAGGFAVFFGGTFLDAVAAGVAGFLVTLLNRHRAKGVNPLVYSLLISFVGALAGLLLVHFGLGRNSDMVIIGIIMLLIPGLALGNAVRDLLFGDVASGLMQIAQAFVTAIMVAAGFSLALLLQGVVFP